MAIRLPGMYGLIVRKNERTREFIDEDRRRFIEFWQARAEDVNEDEHLYGCRAGMNGWAAESTCEALIKRGMVRGIDFVLTASGEGVLDEPHPLWLTMTLAPTGNPPELEAQMDPEVREMWENSRVKMYHLTPGS